MASNYRTEEERLEHWKQGFERRMEELLKENPLPIPIPRDLTDIKLINAEDEKEDLEKRVKDYAGEHKTNEYYAIEDARHKLTIKLDAIEVSGDQKYRERRTQLYAKLDEIQKALLNKIHSGHARCEQCIQVKVVDVKLDK